MAALEPHGGRRAPVSFSVVEPGGRSENASEPSLRALWSAVFLAWIASAWVVGSQELYLFDYGAPAPLRDVPGGFFLGVLIWIGYVAVTSLPPALLWAFTGWGLQAGVAGMRVLGGVLTTMAAVTALAEGLSGEPWLLSALALLAPIAWYLVRPLAVRVAGPPG